MQWKLLEQKNQQPQPLFSGLKKAAGYEQKRIYVLIMSKSILSPFFLGDAFCWKNGADCREIHMLGEWCVCICICQYMSNILQRILNISETYTE